MDILKCLNRFVKEELVGLHVWLACLDRAANNICFTHLCQGSSSEDAAVENMLLSGESCVVYIKNMHLILESLYLWIALTSAIMMVQLSTVNNCTIVIIHVTLETLRQ